MEELNKFGILEISKIRNREYLLNCDINGGKQLISVFVEMEKPIFGVNYSDDFILTLRNYPQVSRRLVGIIRDFHIGKEIDLPIPLLVDKNVPELQAA
jgi:hypothetical protein